MSAALVLIDIQNDYFPGGAMILAGADAAGERAAALLDGCRSKGMPVIHIRHIAVRPGGTFFLPGTPGAELHPCVVPIDDEPVIIKHYPNAFRETGLEPELRKRGIVHVLFAGMMTHMCVDTTVRAAKDLGFECSLAHDACATKDLLFGDRRVSAEDVQTAYCAALHGSFAKVVSVAELAEER